MAIGPTYRDFFKRTQNERDILMCGGRRSGKTFSTFRHLQVKNDLIGGGRKVLVCTYQNPALQATMEDFYASTGMTIRGNFATGYTAVSKYGTLWQFRSFDTKEKAQGTQCDDLFINEAVNMPEDVAIVLRASVRDQIYYNFNPTKHWWGEAFENETNTLVTTFRDNPYLTPEQVEDFERYRERAQRPNATRFDQYAYQVYYLGNYANMVGSVFGTVESCTREEYFNLPAMEALGMDFGFATDGDPTTLMGVKIYAKKIYVHQYIYERGLTSDEELAHRLVALGVTPATQIFADYGGMGRGRMQTLITADNGRWEGDIAGGFAFCNAIKTTIMDGLSQMLSMDGIVVTEGSDLARLEFEGYALDENGKPHGDDHAIDAARYAYTYLNRVI